MKPSYKSAYGVNWDVCEATCFRVQIPLTDKQSCGSQYRGQNDYNDIQVHIRQQLFDVFTIPICSGKGRYGNDNGE